MKKTAFLLLIVITSCLTSCKNNEKKDTQTTIENSSGTMQPQDNEKMTKQKSSTDFDISSIPVSDAELGDFPFFSLPTGLKEQNKPVKRSFDKLYFPINGVMTPIEGKVYKINVETEKTNEEDWSLPYFEKSYDDAITAVGGVKIFDGEITNDEYEKYHDKATYLGEDGSIGYVGQNIKVYVIRQPNGDDIYIQLTGNTASGYLNILQKAPFKQTITMLKSDQIQKDLNEKGKAVLHINFETDKATLKSDGEQAVAEIVKTLKTDRNLKIAINGYTDNVGSESHNLDLSKARANTVLNAISKAGIEKSRLTADGFGSKNPIADNSTEEGKAQNRRVELVKK